MWQYTTETIINSLDGKLTGGKKIVVTDTKDNGGKLLIEGVGAFDLDKIEGAKIWKRVYQPAVPALKEVQIPSTITAVDATNNPLYYRLQIWVSEEGTIRPELQNAMLMKSLPFQFEVKALSAGTTTTTGGVTTQSVSDEVVYALYTAIKKMFAKKGADRLFNVDYELSTISSGKETTPAKLILTATDCYVRFDAVRLDKINDTVNLTGYQDYDEVPLTASANDVRGTEGNGTVARLVKNLRLPTKASLDPFGADHGGKPVPGGKYNQYMFEYVTDRSHVGHQVFGSVGDKSLTTHILFIEGYDEATSAISGAAAEFETLLKNKGITVDTYAPTTASVARAQEGRGAKK